jgi:hypothetical protein
MHPVLLPIPRQRRTLTVAPISLTMAQGLSFIPFLTKLSWNCHLSRHELGDLAPTGKRATFSGMNIFRFESVGKVGGNRTCGGFRPVSGAG